MFNLFRRFIPASALAVTLIFGLALRAFADQPTLEITGVNGVATDGVYVDPYFGTVSGGSTQDLFCDDFAHEISVPSMWTVHETSIGMLSNEVVNSLPLTVRFTGPLPNYTPPFTPTTEVLENYEIAGVLVSEMAAAPSSLYSDYSFALWNLFDPADVSGADLSGYDANAAALETDATDWVSDHTQLQVLTALANLEIYTPTTPSGAIDSGAGSPQEFLGFNGPPPPPDTFASPEPSTLLLMGFGLLMIVGIIRRRGTGTEKVSFTAAI